MKYLRMYEDINEIESDLKKLLSHFIKILSSLGYDYNSYLDRREWQTEFYKGKEYSFCIKMKVDIFTKKHDIDLKLIQSLAYDDEFSVQFADYLKTINGIKFFREEKNPFKTNKLGNTYFYTIKGGNIDNIINQITEKDIELKITSYKFNL
jgi:YHS domain-containing protein